MPDEQDSMTRGKFVGTGHVSLIVRHGERHYLCPVPDDLPRVQVSVLSGLPGWAWSASEATTVPQEVRHHLGG